MKMEIAIEATRDGTVSELCVSEGSPVVPGQRVATLRVK
jgi:biotin carboxyl carrier protein